MAALICAYHEAEGPQGGLRALLPLAGRTLLDRQVRQAAAAGASLLIVLVERVPPELLAVIDQLRRQRLNLIVARTPEEAAAAVDPFDRLLLIGDGFLAGQDTFTHAAGTGGNLLLTVPDKGFDERYERIDAETRWAGLAVMSGAALRETAAMLRDWDLQSTMLRRAVQNNAAREPAPPGAAIVAAADELSGAESRLLADAEQQASGWAERFVFGPLEARATPRLAASGLSGGRLGAVAAGIASLAAVLAFADLRWGALLLLLLAVPLRRLGRRLGRLRLDVVESWGWAEHILPLAAGAALIGLGLGLGREAGWGASLMAVMVLAFVFAQRVELSDSRPPAAFWMAEPGGMALLMLPFAALGQWLVGLCLLFVYAAGSFFWAQRAVHGSAGKAQEV